MIFLLASCGTVDPGQVPGPQDVALFNRSAHEIRVVVDTRATLWDARPARAITAEHGDATLVAPGSWTGLATTYSDGILDDLLISIYAQCVPALTEDVVREYGVDALPLVRMLGLTHADLAESGYEIVPRDLCRADPAGPTQGTPQDLVLVNTTDRPVLPTIANFDHRSDFESALRRDRFEARPNLLKPGDSVGFTETYWDWERDRESNNVRGLSADWTVFWILAVCPSELTDAERTTYGHDAAVKVLWFGRDSIDLARQGFKVTLALPDCGGGVPGAKNPAVP